MPFIGQAIPHGHARLCGKLLNVCLGKAAELNAVVHAAEHARGVLDGLLLAHLRARGIQVGYAHAQIHGAYLKGATGARGGLLEEQDDVFALQVAVRGARALEVLKVAGECQQVLDLLGREVEQLQKAAARDIDAHSRSFRQGNWSKVCHVRIHSARVKRTGPLC